MKRCYGCASSRPAECFGVDRGRKDGLNPLCKACARKKRREWAARNPEKKRAATSAWQKRNPQKVLAAVKRWQAKNPEKVKAIFKRWYDANTDKAQRWAREHPEEMRAHARRWAANNAEKVRANCSRRRARVAGAVGSHSVREWRSVVELFGGRCAYCLRRCDALTRDHFRPLNRGGSDDIENIVPACGSCNPAKRDDLVFGFVPRGIGVCQPSI